MKGLYVQIYRSRRCSACNRFWQESMILLTGESVAPVFESQPGDKIAVLKSRNGHRYVEPVEPVKDGETGYMMGGAFVFSSDARFPSDYPLPLHDRTEVSDGK